MKNSIAAVENNAAVPQKTKNRISIGFSNSTSGYVYRRVRNGSGRKIANPRVFVAPLFMADKRQKELSISKRMAKENGRYSCGGIL